MIRKYGVPTIRKEQSHDLSHGFFSMNKLALYELRVVLDYLHYNKKATLFQVAVPLLVAL
jgi:hypothetical protein